MVILTASVTVHLAEARGNRDRNSVCYEMGNISDCLRPEGGQPRPAFLGINSGNRGGGHAQPLPQQHGRAVEQVAQQYAAQSEMTEKFGTEMAIANRLIGFIHGKKKIEVDPEWDKKWITYSDNSEKTAKMFGYGTKYRELLMPSQLDFILWTDRSIVFGSKNDIVFEDGNGKDVRQNVRDSIGEILQDFDAIVLYCT